MTRFHYSPPPEAARILLADAHVLVVDKPAGLLSVPGRGEDRADCLIKRLRVDFPTVLLVHRLDLDTSGVIVFALTADAQRDLGRQFETRSTSKAYTARLAGHLSPAEGRVDLPLIVDWPNRPRQHVNVETGRPAQTDWRVLSHRSRRYDPRGTDAIDRPQPSAAGSHDGTGPSDPWGYALCKWGRAGLPALDVARPDTGLCASRNWRSP